MALADELATLQSNLVTYGFKAWGYHWNVEGSDFPEWHDKFGDIYDTVFDMIDPVAENIRKLGQYAPFKLASFQKLTTLKDTTVPTDPTSMAKDLLANTIDLVTQLKALFTSATKADEQAIANYIAEILDTFQKWAWQLTASTK